MNLIVVCLDSFRQDHVSFYNGGEPVFGGVPACRTPNIDAFARESVVFSNAYPCGLPTLPVRTELMTGQYTLPTRPWQPLAPADLPVAEILSREGYVSGLISDVWHYRAPGMNYHRGFNAYRWIRGQEYDPYRSSAPRRDIEKYVNRHYGGWFRKLVARFLANTDGFKRPGDWFPASVCAEACEWLKENRGHGNVFCWIDSFDPHEPWDPPAKFDKYTDPKYRGKRLIMPMGGPAKRWASKAEQRHIQGLYAGEAAFVDHCLGELFHCLKKLGFYDDGVILLLADHGHPLADHGKFLKGGDRMYSELLKVPFMIRLPGGAGARRTEAIVQYPDVLPTLLDLLGLGANNAAMHGKSFVPVLRGLTDFHREAAIAGYHESEDRCIRDVAWSLVLRPEGQPDELYNLARDPRERVNLIDRHPGEARRLASAFGSIFKRRASGIIKGVQGKYEVAAGAVE